MRLLFVYGTLRKGESGHHFLRSARYVGTERTKPFYQMRDLGKFPGMVSGGSQSIVGEVYEVDDAVLSAIDRFKGHPDFYRRTPLVLSCGLAVETYLLRRDQVRDTPVVRTGDWRMIRGTTRE